MWTILAPVLEIAAYVMVTAGALHLYAKRFQVLPGLVPRVYVGLLCALMLAAAVFSLAFEVPLPTVPTQALGQAHHRTSVVIGMGVLCLALLVTGKPHALAFALLCILVAACKGLAHSLFLEPTFDIYKTGLATAILASDAVMLTLATSRKQNAHGTGQRDKDIEHD